MKTTSMIPIAYPLLGAEEQEAGLRVLSSGQLAQGEHVAAFEKQFAELCEVPEAVAVSSGTAALHLALLAHGIGPGDEVNTTAFSFAATANVIVLVGAIPVFVDDPLFGDAELLALGYTPLISDHSGEICAIILHADHQVYQEFDFSRYSNCQVVLDGRRALRREWIESDVMQYVAIGDGYHKTLKKGETSNSLPLQFVSEGVK
jgi:hypothetical protein